MYKKTLLTTLTLFTFNASAQDFNPKDYLPKILRDNCIVHSSQLFETNYGNKILERKFLATLTCRLLMASFKFRPQRDRNIEKLDIYEFQMDDHLFENPSPQKDNMYRFPIKIY
jgi:hypothetical protein